MLKLAPLAAICCLAVSFAAPASAKEQARFLPTVERTVSAAQTTFSWCDQRLGRGSGVAVKRYVAPLSGFVSVRLSGARKGNWDLGVFDTSGNRRAASLGFGSDELAQTWVKSGELLAIQACRRAGSARQATLQIDFADVQAPSPKGTPQLVKVAYSSNKDLERIEALGLDLTHRIGNGTADVIVANAAERSLLTDAGFSVRTEVANLQHQFMRSRAKELSYAMAEGESPLPSGRTTYRVLSDYQKDLADIATKYPAIVKPMELPQKSFQGRPLQGVEIAKNVKAAPEDGRPVYLVVGAHHAREWPSGEAAMEFAITLAEGYGENERITNLLERTRVVIVPHINPDGFVSSRGWPLDPADLLGGGGDPTQTGEDNPGQGISPDAANPCGGRPDPSEALGEDLCDALHTCIAVGQNDDGSCGAALDLYLAEGIAPPGGIFSYRRKNCDGLVPSGLFPCELQHGVDPNRNYGQSWGGPGSDANRDGQGYRGAGMWSEPETQAVHEYSQSRQITTIITIHNVAALVLRPPGIHDEGKAPDEARMKELGDAMAKAAGYTSQYGFELYDTAGTTEDWNYAAAGTYGFTIEIGPENGEFHMPYKTGFIDQWTGDYEPAERGKGLREALLLAGETAAKPADHSVITGNAKPGNVLRLRKDFKTSSYHTAFCKEQLPGFGILVATDGQGCVETQEPFQVDDFLQSTLTVPESGSFEWHVNPSTRPFVGKDQPAPPTVIKEDVFEGSGTPAPSTPIRPGETEYEFEVPNTGADTLTLDLTFPQKQEDYDLYLCKKDTDGGCQPFGKGSGASPGVAERGSGAAENINAAQASHGNLAGSYVARVAGFTSATNDYTLTVKSTKDTGEVIKGKREAWTLTCETADGKVLESQKVTVDRGESVNVAFGGPCKGSAAAPQQQQKQQGGEENSSGGGSTAPTSPGTQPQSNRGNDDAVKRKPAAKKKAAKKRKAAAKKRKAKKRCVKKAKKLKKKKRRKAALKRCNKKY